MDTKKCARDGEPVTKQFSDDYRLRCIESEKFKRPPVNPMPNHRPNDTSPDSGEHVNWTWEEYVSRVKSGFHNSEDAFEQLRMAQSWFASKPSFANLSLEQRQAICGVLFGDQVLASFPSVGWARFGSMFGFGMLKKKIKQGNEYLSRAIDQIPNKGIVTREHYKAFCVDYNRVFEDSSRKGGHASASRLLAMKRPDVFICINKFNASNAAKLFEYKPSHLTLESYWDLIILPVRTSEWYQVVRPKGPLFETELWEARVAILDTILYEP